MSPGILAHACAPASKFDLSVNPECICQESLRPRAHNGMIPIPMLRRPAPGRQAALGVLRLSGLGKKMGSHHGPQKALRWGQRALNFRGDIPLVDTIGPSPWMARGELNRVNPGACDLSHLTAAGRGQGCPGPATRLKEAPCRIVRSS